MRISDWSSDVCSSDLIVIPAQAGIHERRSRRLSGKAVFMDSRLRGNDRKDDSPRIAALLHAKGGGVGLAQQIRALLGDGEQQRSEEHTSELQSLMRISYAVFCLKKKKHSKHANLS